MDRILAAAARVFGENGYASTTTDHIATAAGLSVGSLYQYFPSKDAILHELAIAHIDEADAAIDDAIGPGAGNRTLQDWVEPLVTAVVDLHAVDPHLQRVIFDQAPRSPELVERFAASQSAAIGLIADQLREEPGLDHEDATRTALFVAALIESLTHQFIGTGLIDRHALVLELTTVVNAYLSVKTQAGPATPGAPAPNARR
ncbi:TetR/AcrR family transcriptional regulator [Aeromicrobium sp. CTD01-1L150]|uniref:TetR/AcrR family transcriptional regulator n=1 Tax=Aeromicrobium sp. CTD01-1L150 TaxID=3341830 RepID=UPI0035BF68B7